MTPQTTLDAQRKSLAGWLIPPLIATMLTLLAAAPIESLGPPNFDPLSVSHYVGLPSWIPIASSLLWTAMTFLHRRVHRPWNWISRLATAMAAFFWAWCGFSVSSTYVDEVHQTWFIFSVAYTRVALESPVECDSELKTAGETAIVCSNPGGDILLVDFALLPPFSQHCSSWHCR